MDELKEMALYQFDKSLKEDKHNVAEFCIFDVGVKNVFKRMLLISFVKKQCKYRGVMLLNVFRVGYLIKFVVYRLQ